VLKVVRAVWSVAPPSSVYQTLEIPSLSGPDSFRSSRKFAAYVAGSSVAGRLAAGGGSTCNSVVEPGGPGASSRDIRAAREFSALALGLI